MKILFLTTHLNPGGITSYLQLLTDGLIKNGHEVMIASSGGESESFFTEKGATLKKLNILTKSELNPKIYSALFPLIDLIKKEKIDVVHAQTRITQVMGQWLKLLTGVRYCSTCHGFFKTRLSRKVFSCWGDKIIAISPAVKEHLEKDFHIPSGKVNLIRHGIDINDFAVADKGVREEKRREFNLNGDPVIGIIARLSDVKGHDVLIRAMAQVVEKFPRAKLLIVGEGKMESHLRNLVNELSMEGNVKFLPIVNKTADVLPLFDIFVMPSLQEGLGLSVMEAQACGLPVIASRIGGLPSLIEDGKTGLLVEPKDVDGLAKAMILLLEDSNKAFQLGRAARDSIKREFSSEDMIAGTIKMYQELLS